MSRCLAAIQRHHHTTDVARPVRRQEHREVSDLVGLGRAAERHVLGELGPALGIAELLLGLAGSRVSMRSVRVAGGLIATTRTP